jgi:hypothetical protein
MDICRSSARRTLIFAAKWTAEGQIILVIDTDKNAGNDTTAEQ